MLQVRSFNECGGWRWVYSLDMLRALRRCVLRCRYSNCYLTSTLGERAMRPILLDTCMSSCTCNLETERSDDLIDAALLRRDANGNGSTLFTVLPDEKTCAVYSMLVRTSRWRSSCCLPPPHRSESPGLFLGDHIGIRNRRPHRTELESRSAQALRAARTASPSRHANAMLPRTRFSRDHWDLPRVMSSGGVRASCGRVPYFFEISEAAADPAGGSGTAWRSRSGRRSAIARSAVGHSDDCSVQPSCA